MAGNAESGRLTVYTRAEDLPPIWDRLARAGGLGLRRPFLGAVQHSTEGKRNKRYLVYQTPAGAAAIAVGELLHESSTRDPVIGVLLGRLSGRIPGARGGLLPMLLLGTDFSHDVPIIAEPSAQSERSALLSGMLAALEQHANHEGWSLAVANVRAGDAALKHALSQRGYLQTMGRPSAELRLGYESWEKYLEAAATQSKGAAANIRQEMSRARRLGVSIVAWDPARVPESELHRLLAAHDRRLNDREFDYRPQLLGTLVQALGEDVRVLLAVREREVQGVVVLAWAGVRGYLTFAGMIAKAERAGFAYFNLVYYEPIRIALELGLESLAYGNAVFGAKIRRGCTAVETALFFRPRRGVVRAALRGPTALHRRFLQRKYAPILRAPAFSSLR